MRTRARATLAGLLILTSACVVGMSLPGQPGEARDFITRDEMIRANASTVYDAVQKLKPSWFTSRGPTSVTDPSPTMVSVFMNGNEVGDVSYLRGLRPDDVEEIRRYDAGEAGARFGMGHPRGVIEVIPRGS